LVCWFDLRVGGHVRGDHEAAGPVAARASALRAALPADPAQEQSVSFKTSPYIALIRSYI
jgi:hypothetical protein